MTSHEMERELATKIENPAWEYVLTVPHDDMFGYQRSGFTPAAYNLKGDRKDGGYRFFRDHVTALYTWAIPSPESIAFIVATLDGRPVVEIGAGSGYWAWLLAQSGVDVNAYDIAPIGHPKSWFTNEKVDARLGVNHDREIKEFYPVYPGGPEMLQAENPNRVLLLVWPTMDNWAAEALRQFRGDTVIYVGEGSGGCTADSDFFTLVGDECCCWGDEDEKCPHADTEPLFERVEYGPLTQWSGLHDNLVVYRRI